MPTRNGEQQSCSEICPTTIRETCCWKWLRTWALPDAMTSHTCQWTSSLKLGWAMRLSTLSPARRFSVALIASRASPIGKYQARRFAQ